MQQEPIQPSIYKLLMEKNIDKRIQACQQIEQIVKTHLQNNNYEFVHKIIDQFKMQLPLQQKRGAFLVFQQIAIIIVKESKEERRSQFVKVLTEPILELIYSDDDKNRQQYIDNLQMMCKILKGLALVNLSNIFNVILDNASDNNEQVRIACIHLDNTLQKIIKEQAPNGKYFIVQDFVDQLARKLKNNNPLLKIFLIQWINTLHEMGSLQFFKYLPQLMEGLCSFLDGQETSIQKSVDHMLTEFQKEISPVMIQPNFDQKITGAILDILIKVSNNYKTFAKLNAILWMREYLLIFQQILDYDENNVLKPKSETNIDQNSWLQLQQSDISLFILPKLPSILDQILILLSHDEEEIRKAAEKTNELLLKIIEKLKESCIDIKNLLQMFQGMLSHNNITAESALIWINHLLQIYPEQLIPLIENILPIIFEKINDSEGPVLQVIMKILGTICLHSEYFDMVIVKILDLFHSNRVKMIYKFIYLGASIKEK